VHLRWHWIDCMKVLI